MALPYHCSLRYADCYVFHTDAAWYDGLLLLQASSSMQPVAVHDDGVKSPAAPTTALWIGIPSSSNSLLVV